MMQFNTAWERWGAIDPYYGVLSSEIFKAGANKEQFFETGKQFVSSVLQQAESAFGTIDKKSALDFGCGVGRLVLPLAGHFSHVTGVDISQSMIAEATRNRDVAGISNVSFTREIPNGQFSFVNSYIVLQHIPVVDGVEIISRLLKAVEIGGIAMLHVSVRRLHPWWREAVYLIKHRVPGGRLLFNFLQRKPFNTPLMQMNEYDLSAVIQLFRENGFLTQIVNAENHGSVLTVRILSKRDTYRYGTTAP